MLHFFALLSSSFSIERRGRGRSRKNNKKPLSYVTPTYATSVHISSILGNEAPTYVIDTSTGNEASTYVIDTSSAIGTTSKVAPRILLHMGGFTMRKLGL